MIEQILNRISKKNICYSWLFLRSITILIKKCFLYNMFKLIYIEKL